MMPDPEALSQRIKSLGLALGFQQVGISDIDLSQAEAHLLDWLEKGFHGEMDYMHRHGTKRSRPDELVPGTLSIISVRMDYLPETMQAMSDCLSDASRAYISRYALGRDYHKLMRGRLQKLAERIAAEFGPFGYRVFTDSAPVLEKPIAVKAGLGWIGKHSNLINSKAGSWFFLGEIYTDLPLRIDSPVKQSCGRCSACISVCPTQAIVAPFQVDARRCISYLTIEYDGVIPEAFRSAIGNRIYGCDDCQIVCPWNKFAGLTAEADFMTREGLSDVQLIALFAWDEAQFLKKTEGSAIRRIGFVRWLRNIAVALGNAPSSPQVIHALSAKKEHASAIVSEHVNWALQKHEVHRMSSIESVSDAGID